MNAVRLWCALLAAWAVSPVWAAKAARRIKPNITVLDPIARLAPVVSLGNASGPELPSALFGVRKADASATPELGATRSPPLDLAPIRQLIEANRNAEALAVVEIWMLLRTDLHTGERLRLSLLKAALQFKGGRLLDATETLYSAKRYLRLATEDLRAPEDLRRVNDLRALIDLTSFEVIDGRQAP